MVSIFFLFGENLNDDSRWDDPFIESRLQMEQFGTHWTGNDGENGGYSSSLPIYIGLMAIAGAYMIKE